MSGMETVLVTSFRSTPSALTHSRLPKSSLDDGPRKIRDDLAADTIIPQLQESVLIPLIKWSLVGYSEFVPHQDFLRYGMLAPDVDRNQETRTACEDICRVCLLPDDYQVGKSVVVLKRGQTALLDSHLSACQEEAATKVQSVARQWLISSREGPQQKIKLDAILKLQTAIRAYRARMSSSGLRDERAEAQEEIRQIQEEKSAMDREVLEEEAATGMGEG